MLKGGIVKAIEHIPQGQVRGKRYETKNNMVDNQLSIKKSSYTNVVKHYLLVDQRKEYMNIKYVTSPELSDQLREAGIPQESEFMWIEIKMPDESKEIILGEKYDYKDVMGGGWRFICSAFHVGELGEMLPKLFSTWKTLNGKGDETYCCFSESRGLYEHGLSEAEARGRMVLYLKKEGLI